MSSLNWPIKPYQIWMLIDHLNEYDRLIQEALDQGDMKKACGWKANQDIVIEALCRKDALRLA